MSVPPPTALRAASSTVYGPADRSHIGAMQTPRPASDTGPKAPQREQHMSEATITINVRVSGPGISYLDPAIKSLEV